MSERLHGTMTGYEIEIEGKTISFTIDYSYDSRGPVEPGQDWDPEIQVESATFESDYAGYGRVPDFLFDILSESASVFESINLEIEYNS